jgi:hypothetical protein
LARLYPPRVICLSNNTHCLAMGILKYPGQSVAQSLESVNVHPVLK